jgi:hypothetical protein
MQRADIWLNEFALAEVKIIELCIKKATQFRNDSATASVGLSAETNLDRYRHRQVNSSSIEEGNVVASNDNVSSLQTDIAPENLPGIPNLATNGGPFQWQGPWADPLFSLLEPADIQQWENVLNSITQDQMMFGLQ